jgi:hypothetical protein
VQFEDLSVMLCSQHFKVMISCVTYSSSCACRPEQTEQRFVCSVKLPAVVRESGGVVAQVLGEEVFQGEGRKKADAKVCSMLASLLASE